MNEPNPAVIITADQADRPTHPYRWVLDETIYVRQISPDADLFLVYNASHAVVLGLYDGNQGDQMALYFNSDLVDVGDDFILFCGLVDEYQADAMPGEEVEMPPFDADRL